jgi:hypothetical protein
MVLADISAERFELLGPASLGVFQPSAQTAERLLSQLVHTDSGVESGLPVADQTPLAEDAQVFAHCGWGDSQRPGELPGPMWALRQQLDGAATQGVG